MWKKFNNKEDKKERYERYIMTSFLKTFKQTFSSLEKGDHNKGEPDFIVNFNSQKVGFELTELFIDSNQVKGSKMKRNETLNIKSFNELKNIYYELSDTPIMVNLQYSHIDWKSTVGLEYLAHHFKETAYNLQAMEWKEKIITNYGWYYLLRLPKEKKFIEYKRWTLLNDVVGWVKKESLGVIQKAINKKTPKYEIYKSSVEKTNLILHINSHNNSGKIDFRQLDTELINKEPFENIFIFNMASNDLIIV